MNTAGKELFELRYVIQQNHTGKNHKSSGQESNVINAEKTKGVKDGKADNHNSGNSGNAGMINVLLNIDLSKINIERVMKGFEIGKVTDKGITPKFEELLKGFDKLTDKSKINDQVGKTIDGEIDNVMLFLKDQYRQGNIPETSKTTMDGIIKKLEERRQGLKEEFVQVLEKRVKGEKINKQYTDNVNWLTKRMDMFVNNMDIGLKDKIINGSETFGNITIIESK